MNQQSVKLPGFSLAYIIYDIVVCSLFMILLICGTISNASKPQQGGGLGMILSVFVIVGLIIALAGDINIISKKRSGIKLAYIGMVFSLISILMFIVSGIMTMSALDTVPIPQSQKDMVRTVTILIFFGLGFVRVIHFIIYFFAVKKASEALKPQQFGFN